KDDHPAPCQVVQHALHPGVFRRAWLSPFGVPQHGDVPPAAAAGRITAEIVTGHRQHVVLIFDCPIQKRLSLLLWPVPGKEPVADMKAADKDVLSTLEAEPYRICFIR